ncbi:MAG: hypothetical protein WKG07_25660 [Hymenobacter sp.]
MDEQATVEQEDDAKVAPATGRRQGVGRGGGSPKTFLLPPAS